MIFYKSTFKKGLSVCLIFLTGSLFYSNAVDAQCGFLPTCSSTDYLNFGMGSNTNATTLEYDNFLSGYHCTVVRTSSGNYKTWGQDMGNDGVADILTPMIINNANFPALTGNVLKAHLGSTGSSAAQGIVLATDGLYAWSAEGLILHANITSSTTFQKLTINGNTQGLPAGVAPTDVKMMFSTNQTLGIVTCTGNVWVITQQGENTGTGLTGVLSAAAAVQWYQVTESTGGNPVLSNVIQLRGQKNTLFALKSDGTLWTWGTETYLANGTAQGSLNRATQMTLPSVNPIKMIGATRNNTGNVASYYVLNADGNMYSLGNNASNQLGDWTTTERRVWVQPRFTSTVGPIMNNIHWISPQEHDRNTPSVNIITTDSTNYNWGSAAGQMLGRGGTGNFNPGIPNGILITDKVLAVETGGHTSMLAKKCEDFFGYVGHRIGGSMGDGTTTDFFEPTYTFATAIVYICGATTATVEVSGTPTLSPGGLYCNGTSTDLLPSPAGGTLSILSGPATLAGTIITFNGTGNTTVVVQYSITVPGCPIAKVATTTLLTEDCILPTVTLTGTTTIAENAVGTTTLTATLSAVSPSATTVTLTYTGTATGGDYVASSVTIIIPAGSLTGTVTIDPTDDIIFEGSETVIADITSVTSSSGVTETGTQTATVTITDNEVAPTVTLTGTTSIAENAAGVATLTATLSVATTTATTVTLTYTGTTAAGDYVASSVTIVIPAGSLTGTVTIDPTDDIIFEGSETVIADITSVTGGNGATESGTQTATVTITDDEITPTVTLTGTTSIAENAAGVATLTATLSVATTTATTVTLTYTGTATGGDYVASSVTIVIPAGSLTGTVTIDPTDDVIFEGSETVIADITSVTGGNGATESGTQTATVTILDVNNPPIAIDNSISTNEDVTVVLPTIQINDLDLDGTVIVGTIDLDPSTAGQQTSFTNAQGLWTVNTSTGDVTFNPILNYNGIATITYTIQDNSGATSNQANLTITVAPINDSPIVDNDVNTTTEDTPTVGGDLTDVGDIDPDGTLLVVTTTPVDGPNNGTIVINTDGTYVYTPNPNFNGIDTIVVSVCDQGLPFAGICVNDTLFITVTPVNDSPLVDNDVNTTTEDTPTVGGDLTDVGDIDPDGTLLVVTTTPVDGPNNGTIVINTDGTYVYTPNSNFNGTDTIVISVCDQGLPLPAICVNDTLFITVTPVNDSPVVDNDVNTTTEDTPTVGGDLTDVGDTDPDGTLLVVTTTPVDGPNNGTIVINTDGTYVYTPNSNFNGTDTIVISVCDQGLPLPAICVNDTLFITVTPVNDSPVVDNDVNTTTEDNPTVGGDLTDSGDFDVDGNLVVTTAPISGPSNGTIVINSNGTYTYTPTTGFTGLDTIIIQICDDGTPLPVICVNDTLFINVLPCSILTLTADCDGDGVTNGDEVDPDGDGIPGPNGTNPNDPCDLNIADQVFASTSAAWLAADCDGDGVSNEEEVDPDGDGTPGPNGTNPVDPCDYDAASQIFASVTLVWLTADCDGDGEDNGDEVDPDGDGTPGPNGSNPTNPCDYTNQIFVNASPVWLVGDCDGDGVNNGDEVDPDGDGLEGPNGTNPSDSCDFNSLDQNFANVSAAWLLADCDGDGVTNGDEVDPDGDGTPGPNGTDPSNPCDLNITDQNFAIVNAAWLVLDCDGDGEENGDEVDPDGDGTPGPNGSNPTNPCDYTTQFFANVTPAWLTADCDGDGVTNGDEVDPDGDGTPGPNGTNPSDPCDLNIADQVFANANLAWLAADCDGDGVDNGDEVDPDGDGTPGPNGTNPADSCEYNSIDQIFANASAAWLAADCDGDGVTNGDEVDPDGDGTPGPNGTNPADSCDYNSIDQIFANVSAAWLAADCDGDGVDNGDEVDPDGDGSPGPNGTNPSDPCDLNIADQVFANASAAWLAADCDGDGIPNGEEVMNGSDPFNPCSPNLCDINVPEAFTPDGDGINEFFVIEGIELIPDNTIIIFNRWGSVVYSVSKYQNDWNGTTNVTLTVDGDVLPTGTYYYVFDTGVDKYGVIKGYVYIQR